MFGLIIQRVYNQMPLKNLFISPITIAVILVITSCHLQSHENVNVHLYSESKLKRQSILKKDDGLNWLQDSYKRFMKQELFRAQGEQSPIELLPAQQNLKVETTQSSIPQRFLQEFQLTEVTSTVEVTTQTTLTPPAKPLQLDSAALLSQLTPVKQIITKNSQSPYQPSNSANLNFENIVLYQKVPSNFIQNQIFSFRGSLLASNLAGTMINVVFTRVGDAFRMVFSKNLQANETMFNIATALSTPGSYYLAVFKGNSGKSLVDIFTVHARPQLFVVLDPPLRARSAKLELKGSELWVSWQSAGNNLPCITKLVFKQDLFQVTYLVSNFQTAFQVPFSDFYMFREAAVTIEITQAFSNTQSAYQRNSQYSQPYVLSFNAVTHHFARFDTKGELNAIPMKMQVGSSLTISGVSKGLLSNEIFLQTPKNQFVTAFILPNAESTIVPANTQINVTFTLNTKGIYILQINNAQGSAIYNSPVYCGDIYPLLPDFMDLSPKDSNLSALAEPTALIDRQLLVLALINQARKRFNVGSLYLDETLTAFAQNYSQAQVFYNYLGHVDPQGRTLKQRLAAFNITYGVSENLALDMNLTEAELMLERSPAHLRNMVNPAWTRVGLGIAQDSSGYYYLTQEFSFRDMTKFPLSLEELSLIKDQVLLSIKATYRNVKHQNWEISNKLQRYQLSNDVVAFLRGQGVKVSFLAFKITVSYDATSYMELIKGQINFNVSESFTQVGLSVIYSGGLLFVVGVFTT